MENVSLKTNAGLAANNNKQENEYNWKKPALIGAGAALALDTAQFAYNAKQHADSQKIPFKQGLKDVWKLLKECGNVDFKDGVLQSKVVLGISGKKLLAAGLVLSTAAGAALNVAVDKLLFSDKK